MIPSWIDPPPPRVDPPVGRSAHPPRINATTNQLAPALITLRATRFGRPRVDQGFHKLRRDDALLDGLLPLRPFGEDAVHVDVAPLADAQHAPDGLLLVGGGVDAVGVATRQRVGGEVEGPTLCPASN